MARAYARLQLTDTAGNAIANAKGLLYTDEAATVAVTDAFNANSGGSAITFVTTGLQGEAEAFFTADQVFYVKWTDNSNAAYYANATSTLVDFSDFVERHHATLPGTDTVSLTQYTNYTDIPAVGTLTDDTFHFVKSTGRLYNKRSSKLWPAGDQSRTVFNVLDYGAKGDNSTDDTAAFHACIDAAMDASFSGYGTTIVVPISPHQDGVSVPIYKVNLNMDSGTGRGGITWVAEGGYTSGAFGSPNQCWLSAYDTTQPAVIYNNQPGIAIPMIWQNFAFHRGGNTNMPAVWLKGGVYQNDFRDCTFRADGALSADGALRVDGGAFWNWWRRCSFTVTNVTGGKPGVLITTKRTDLVPEDGPSGFGPMIFEDCIWNVGGVELRLYDQAVTDYYTYQWRFNRCSIENAETETFFKITADASHAIGGGHANPLITDIEFNDFLQADPGSVTIEYMVDVQTSLVTVTGIRFRGGSPTSWPNTAFVRVLNGYTDISSIEVDNAAYANNVAVCRRVDGSTVGTNLSTGSGASLTVHGGTSTETDSRQHNAGSGVRVGRHDERHLRFVVDGNGVVNFGQGGATGGVDTNLYRSAANVLKTDDSFVVGTTLYIGATDTPMARTAPGAVTYGDATAEATMALNADTTAQAQVKFQKEGVNKWILYSAASSDDLRFWASGDKLTLSTTALAFAAGYQAATAASSATRAGLNVPHGTAPTSPVDGDIWTTSSGLFVRINGVTVGPLS